MPDQTLTLRHFVYGKFIQTGPHALRGDYGMLALHPTGCAAWFDQLRQATDPLTQRIAGWLRQGVVRLVIPTTVGWLYMRVFPGTPQDQAGRAVQRLHLVVLDDADMEALQWRPWRLDDDLPAGVGSDRVLPAPKADAPTGAPPVGATGVDMPISVSIGALPPAGTPSAGLLELCDKAHAYLRRGWSIAKHSDADGDDAQLAVMGELLARSRSAGEPAFGVAVGMPPPGEQWPAQFDAQFLLRAVAFAAPSTNLPGHWANVDVAPALVTREPKRSPGLQARPLSLPAAPGAPSAADAAPAMAADKPQASHTPTATQTAAPAGDVSAMTSASSGYQSTLAPRQTKAPGGASVSPDAPPSREAAAPASPAAGTTKPAAASPWSLNRLSIAALAAVVLVVTFHFVRVGQWQSTLAERDGRITDLTKTVTDQNTSIETLTAQRDFRAGEAVDRQQMLGQLNARLGKLDAQLRIAASAASRVQEQLDETVGGAADAQAYLEALPNRLDLRNFKKSIETEFRGTVDYLGDGEKQLLSQFDGRISEVDRAAAHARNIKAARQQLRELREALSLDDAPRP